MPKLSPYRNQLDDLHYKSTDWFLYHGNLGVQWVKFVTLYVKLISTVYNFTEDRLYQGGFCRAFPSIS